MDTIIMLGSLLGLGYFLNQEKQIRNQPQTRNIVDAKHVPNSYNIYEGNMVNVVREHEQGLGNELYEKSKNATKTRIIPPLYNSGNSIAVQKKKTRSLEDSSQRGLNRKQEKKPSFPKDVKLEKTADYDPLVVAVDSQESGGFNNILKQDFSHQNMVPFFSGSGTNQNLGNNAQPSILERFTGSGGLIKPGKKEANTFFKPEKNPNVFTTDLPDDDTRTRYNTSELKTDQLPFQQERVGPGLNQGFKTEGTDGFHSMYRAPQQTIDELRVKTNPKDSYKNRLSAATPIYNQARGNQSIMQKNQPERTFEKLSFISATPSGINIKPKLNENFSNLKHTTREQNQELSGRVGTQGNERNVVRGEYSDPSKHSNETYDTGAISNSINKHIVYDENDLPQTTIKETTMSSYIGMANQNKGKGYLTTTYLAPTTIKETTQTEYFGIAEGSEQQMSQQQYYNAEINGMKESTLHNREPTIVKEQQFYGKEDVNQVVNHNVRQELQEEMAKYQNITNIYSQEPLSSRITNQKEESKKIDNRFDPIFTEQVRKNPFSHPLN